MYFIIIKGFLPMQTMAQRLIDEYLKAVGLRDDQKGPLCHYCVGGD